MGRHIGEGARRTVKTSEKKTNPKTHIYRHYRAAREARGAIIFFLVVLDTPRIDPATRLAPGRPPKKFHFFGRPARIV